MKKCIITRISDLEKSAKSIYGEQYFEEWLEKHATDPNQDCWALLEIVPEEMRLQCLFRIFKKMRECNSTDISDP